MNKPLVCPAGYILRKGYTRKFRSSIKNTGYTVRRKGKLYIVRPKSNTVHVEAGCIKARTAKNNSNKPKLIGKLRKGDLIKYGYQYRLSDSLREKALVKAIKVYGALSVYRKLDAVAKLSIQRAPEAHIIFVKDRDWIRSNYTLKENN
jgi:ribosomal protein L36